jgi:hypothetical protein
MKPNNVKCITCGSGYDRAGLTYDFIVRATETANDTKSLSETHNMLCNWLLFAGYAILGECPICIEERAYKNIAQTSQKST